MKLIDTIMNYFGYVSKSRIPQLGLMYANPAESPEGESYSDVEVLEITEYWVKFKLPNGNINTRSRRGFMKNYSTRK